MFKKNWHILIKSLVIFGKSNMLDWYNTTEDSKYVMLIKKGKKDWIILTLIVCKALVQILKVRIQHGGKCNNMLHRYTKSSLHYMKLSSLSIRLNVTDRCAQRPILGLSCSVFFNCNLKG